MVDAQDQVYALTTSPNFAQDGVCFAARQTGLYRSEDSGATWRLSYGSLQLDGPLATTAVAVSPAFASDHSVFAGVQGGVMRSVDGGDTWHSALFPSPPPLVSALVISPNFVHDGTLFAGTLEDGVLCSTDRGSHWTPWNFGLLDRQILSLAISPDFAQDGTLFAGTESGVYCSTNGGRAWKDIDFADDMAPVLSLTLSPAYARDGVVFAGTESWGLWRSNDRGRTWTPVDKEAITGPVNGIVCAPTSNALPDVLVVLSATLLVSRDGGQSWATWKADLPILEGLMAAAAPYGLGADTFILVGSADGRVLQI